MGAVQRLYHDNANYHRPLMDEDKLWRRIERAFNIFWFIWVIWIAWDIVWSRNPLLAALQEVERLLLVSVILTCLYGSLELLSFIHRFHRRPNTAEEWWEVVNHYWKYWWRHFTS